MPIAYLSSQTAEASAAAGFLRITDSGEERAAWPLATLEAFVVVGRPRLTLPLLHQLLERGIPTSFITVHGRYRGRLQPPAPATLGPRLAQYAALGQPNQTLPLARALAGAKLEAQAALLAQQARGDPTLDLAAALATIREARRALEASPDRERLRGHEGIAAASYWSAFMRCLRVPHAMRCRATRPPPDAINSALSFGYALLLGECSAAIQVLDLDPAVGIHHTLRHRRPALALDLMEPFRQPVVDRLVLRSFNRRQLRDEHFEARDGGVYLNDLGRPVYLALFDELVESNDGLASPADGGALSWREAIRHSTEGFRRELLALRLAPLAGDTGTGEGDEPPEVPPRPEGNDER